MHLTHKSTKDGQKTKGWKEMDQDLTMEHERSYSQDLSIDAARGGIMLQSRENWQNGGRGVIMRGRVGILYSSSSII